MPIYQTAHYQINASAVDKVTTAIAEVVEYVAKNEPGTRMYTAWQQKDDPTRFVHLFEFADEAAHRAPRPPSGGSKPSTVSSSPTAVAFTDYAHRHQLRPVVQAGAGPRANQRDRRPVPPAPAVAGT